ncbi:MAG: hypothetical protein K6357_00450 [Elusimicrobiota bacterium]
MKARFLIYNIFIFLIFGQVFMFGNDYNNFKSASLTSIQAFTEDLGNIVGASTLYSARVLGFGGFAVSYKTAYQTKPLDDDTIFNKNKAFGINYVQVETGLPYRIDTYLRAGGDDGFNVIGGGIKYGIRNVTDELYKVNIALSLNSHMGLYKYFYMTSFGAQLAFSMRLTNYMMPYISGGFDSVELRIKTNNDISLEDKSIFKKIQRYTIGMRFKIKLVNLSVAYDLYKERSGFNASAGIRF